MTEAFIQVETDSDPERIVSRALTNDTLARLLDQSLDCIKLIGLNGAVRYMNGNGLCAMEIDDSSAVLGRIWHELWPAESKPLILDAMKQAAAGKSVRFDAFCPTAKGSPRWWDVSVAIIRDDDGHVLGFLATSRDVSEARRAKEVAEIASAEMRHRIKNSYAMVAGLLSSLARGFPEREEFAAEIRTRLTALGVAQTLFVARENAPCELSELMPALLDPFGHADCPLVLKVAPNLSVEQGVADALALVIGELAVNSTKHGALSASGAIAVTAERIGDQIAVRWVEQSAVPVGAHERSGGQGLRLMQRILTARDGDIHIDWRESGLEATIRVPRVG